MSYLTPAQLRVADYGMGADALDDPELAVYLEDAAAAIDQEVNAGGGEHMTLAYRAIDGEYHGFYHDTLRLQLYNRPIRRISSLQLVGAVGGGKLTSFDLRTYPPGDPPPIGPVSAAPGAGGQVTPGLHLWAFTFVDTAGNETGLSPAAAAQTATPSNGTVTLSALPLGTTVPAADGSLPIAGRNVYRTKAGTTRPFYLVDAILDTVTTTYVDTKADAALGALRDPDSYPAAFGTVMVERETTTMEASSLLLFTGAFPFATLLSGIRVRVSYTAGYDDGTPQSDGMSVPCPAWLQSATRHWTCYLLGMRAANASGSAGLSSLHAGPMQVRRLLRDSSDHLAEAKAILARQYEDWVGG